MSEFNPYAAPRVDDGAVVPADGPAELNLAGPGTRFLNLVIDQVVRMILVSILTVVLTLSGVPVADLWIRLSVSLLLVLAYYVLFEGLFGFTIGKLITGTRVVDERGNRPRFGQIVGRTFSRLVPFEQFSFFGTPSVGWHDEWSGTRVVKIRR